jgi:hypothetical protein
MEKILKDYTNRVHFGKRQSHRNMAVFPVIMEGAPSPDYLTLDQAMQDRAIEITEVSEGGSVPDLKVTNNSSRNVLILDGEELVGAKQNRVINTTILIGPRRTVVISVSCVEQGRWSSRSKDFSSEDRMMTAKMRTRKLSDVKESLRRGGSYQSDQVRVWGDVNEMMCCLECDSPTSAMSEIYEQKRGDLDEYLKHFRIVENQVGIVVMIDGKVMGGDSFGARETLEKVFTKIVTSYALDALETADRGEKVNSSQAVRQFCKEVQKARVQTRPSVDLGTDIRLENERVIGSALGHEDQILHLSVFAKESQSHPRGGSGRSLRRASLRRDLLV